MTSSPLEGGRPLRGATGFFARSGRELRGRMPSASQDSIGFIAKESCNPFYEEIFREARAPLKREGLTLVAAASEGNPQTERDLIDAFRDRQVRGLIMDPVLEKGSDLSHLLSLQRSDIPFVLLERVRELRAPAVSMDSTSAMKRATRYLIEHGHERIVHFAGPAYTQHARDRLQGVRAAFAEAALPLSNCSVVPAGARIKDGYQRGRHFFREQPQADWPSAAVCFNDLVAIGLMRALREESVHVPEDLSVLGCDDIPAAAQQPISLTTMRVPGRSSMGMWAADLLLRQLHRAEGDATKKVCLTKVLPTAELVERNSTRALR